MSLIFAQILVIFMLPIIDKTLSTSLKKITLLNCSLKICTVYFSFVLSLHIPLFTLSKYS